MCQTVGLAFCYRYASPTTSNPSQRGAQWQEATQKAKFELANGCHHFRALGLGSCHIIGGSCSPNPSMF